MRLPLEKNCIVEGCARHPCWGKGSALEGTLRFACGEHKHLLERASSLPDSSARRDDRTNVEQLALMGVLKG